MKLGIVGLPNVGKSTLFNAITRAGAQAANYPFCTIEPNTGVVPVPDKRLDVLAEMYHPKKVTPATIEFVDIAGLVKGASKGEGLGNKFLSHIRECDAIVHVVRCFEDENIIHVDGTVDPARDIDVIQLELVLADLETMQRRVEKANRLLKGGDKKQMQEVELGQRLLAHLEEGKPARTFSMTDEEKEIVHELVPADGQAGDLRGQHCRQRRGHGRKSVALCAGGAEDRRRGRGAGLHGQRADRRRDRQYGAGRKAEFLEELGIGESGLDRLIHASYSLLGLISFLTAGEDECRAWTITRGTKAPQAAGKIHTDFERGFIRAEVVAFDDLRTLGSMNACKEKGLVRSEGKDYVMKDGDIVLFRFNV